MQQYFFSQIDPCAQHSSAACEMIHFSLLCFPELSAPINRNNLNFQLKSCIYQKKGFEGLYRVRGRFIGLWIICRQFYLLGYFSWWLFMSSFCLTLASQTNSEKRQMVADCAQCRPIKICPHFNYNLFNYQNFKLMVSRDVLQNSST